MALWIIIVEDHYIIRTPVAVGEAAKGPYTANLPQLRDPFLHSSAEGEIIDASMQRRWLFQPARFELSEAFDPYYRWLGIGPEEQPPHHYRLLGLRLFEANPDVIESAADRQMCHVQTHKTGPHSPLSQKLLNELSAAKLCLLSADRKAAYDRALAATFDFSMTMPIDRPAIVLRTPLTSTGNSSITPITTDVTVPTFAHVVSDGLPRIIPAAQRRRSKWQLVIPAVSLATTAILLVITWQFLNFDRFTLTRRIVAPWDLKPQPESPAAPNAQGSPMIEPEEHQRPPEAVVNQSHGSDGPSSNETEAELSAVAAIATEMTPSNPITTQIPSTQRFTLTHPSKPLWDPREAKLKDGRVMQSFAFDNTNQFVYAVQLSSGSADTSGDLTVTKLAWDGKTILGHMHLHGFGHGAQIGVEPIHGDAFLWTEIDSLSDGLNAWGKRLGRFKFVDGTQLTANSSLATKYTLIPRATHVSCNVDMIHGRLVINYNLDGQTRFAVYDLSAIKSGNTTGLRDVAFPTGLGTFQGFTSFGSYIYLLTGNCYSNHNRPPGNTHITVLDINTGEIVDHQRTNAGTSLSFREPQGMAVWSSGEMRRLCFGFATQTSGGARKASIYYKDALIGP